MTAKNEVNSQRSTPTATSQWYRSHDITTRIYSGRKLIVDCVDVETANTIVHCVNTHDALVEALAHLVQHCDDKMMISDGDSIYMPGSLVSEARQALTLARKEPS